MSVEACFREGGRAVVAFFVCYLAISFLLGDVVLILRGLCDVQQLWKIPFS